MSIYQFTADLIDGKEKSLDDYEGQVVLIVNTATKCGFTPQLEGLESLYKRYKQDGFVVLGFPSNQFANQNPGTNDEVANTCRINYGVTFPLFSEIDVKGPDAHPLFAYLTAEQKGIGTTKIKWNFTKFLVNRDGEVVKRFAPITKPEKIASNIEKLLKR